MRWLLVAIAGVLDSDQQESLQLTRSTVTRLAIPLCFILSAPTGVFYAVGVPTGAMRFGSVSGLKRVTAEMIEFHAIGNRPDQILVGVAMRT